MLETPTSTQPSSSRVGLRWIPDGVRLTANGISKEYNLVACARVDFEVIAAKDLGVEGKDVVAAFLDNEREIDREELSAILSSTVKRDEPTKVVTFHGMLLAQTSEDQFNIAFQAESSAGKSFISLELASYFPQKDVRIYAGASPTSFFHAAGKWKPLTEIKEEVDLKGLFSKEELEDEERKIIYLDLEGRILVFTDSPHWMLMERLRPLLSHDAKVLREEMREKEKTEALERGIDPDKPKLSR